MAAGAMAIGVGAGIVGFVGRLGHGGLFFFCLWASFVLCPSRDCKGVDVPVLEVLENL